MSDEFDPYLKWLGIPPKHQPPHHYRLLGLESFESDPDAIENAADRQMAHLRTFRNGKRVEIAERLLNEIAEAKVCLLNADKKSDYDAKLKALEAKRKSAEAKRNGNGRAAKAAAPLDGENNDSPKRKLPSAPSAKPAVAAPMATAVATAAAPPPKPAVAADDHGASPMMVDAARGAGVATTRRRKQTPWVAMGVLGVIGLGVIAVGAIVLPSLLNPPVDVAAADDGDTTVVPAHANDGSGGTKVNDIGTSGNDGGVTKPPVDDEVTDENPNTENPTASGNDGDEDEKQPWRDPRTDKPPRDNPDNDDEGDAGDEGNDGDEDGDDEGPLNNPRPLPGTEGDDDPEDSDDGDDPPITQVVERKPAPTAAVQKEIEGRVRTLYKMAEATTPEAQGELATKLIADAADTRDSPDDQFVMLRVAAETAAARADVATAMQAVDALAENFEIDAVPLRLELVGKAAKAAVPPEAKTQALRDSLPVLDAALADNKFDEVDSLITALLASARRLNDRDLNTLLIERRKSAVVTKKQYDKAVAALETLKANPDDVAANGVVGSFWAFVKDKWEQGLPYLAKGDDAPAADAAKRELAQAEQREKQDEPVSGEDIAKLADAWFAVAQKAEPPAKYNVLRHAASLYEKAQPDVTGLTKTSVEQQLVEIEKLLAADGPAQPVSRMAHVTMSCDSSFELYINGDYVARSDRDEVAEFDRELKRGDVLLVMGTGSFRGFRRSSERGFAAVIKFEADGSTIVTGQANAWYAYTPASSEAWYDPRGVAGIGPPRLGDGDRHEKIEEQTGIRSQSIWGNNQIRSYFVLRIP